MGVWPMRSRGETDKAEQDQHMEVVLEIKSMKKMWI